MRKRIFLLDDDPGFCEMLKSLLVDLADVFTFTEPDKFLNSLKKKRVDLVIVDYNLNHPIMDGFHVIKYIKSIDDSHLIPILMLSGCDSSETISKAFYSGIEDYMHKPIIPEFFIKKVEHILYNSKIKIHTNALTGLPDITLIEEEYYRWRQNKKNYTVAYVDLDNFKAYNDHKGVKRGDIAIKIIAKILTETRNSFQRSQVFAGHLGGDDFFLVGFKTIIQKFIRILYNSFNQHLKDLFNKKEIENRYYRSKNRKGELEKFPLITISTGLIHVNFPFNQTFEQISSIAAVIKKKAKNKKGNSTSEIMVPLTKKEKHQMLLSEQLETGTKLSKSG